MTSVNVTEFRKHLPAYLDKVKEGEEVYLTNRGKVIARIVPEVDPAEQARALLSKLRKTAIVGDIESPVSDAQWTADEDNL
ncbi:MAG TPA: type II toxin-antitoxin system prevent-host-death family antitoxin [Gammaproteobacteria bacterium]|nr:type II toxin-antitoxin system prevent-host-death family antitoxin [Gammaproteobacteria bacterium]